jgi:molybdopterin/thiamine biosynthesis adenylyltransferase
MWKTNTVRQARALVVGAGALGNEVVKNLAMMGVRFIAVVDRDTVEVANLTRSVFFRESDHGRGKATVLAERLKELNEDVEVCPLNGDLEAVLGLGLLRRMDMIFSCLDNRLARRSVNRSCEKVGKPWVDGSMENLLGDVTVFIPGKSACYECTLTQADKEIIAEAMSCRGVALRNLSLGKVPTVSTMGSIIAAIQVQEGMKLLHNDLAGSLAGKRLVVNCASNDIYSTRAMRKEDCEGHFLYGEITEVPEWRSSQTSPKAILSRFETETDQAGHLRLGREIVISLHCPQCVADQEMGIPLHLLTPHNLKCPTCGTERLAKTTNRIQASDPYADLPLAELGVPKLDIFEVRGPDEIKWYEITGDVNDLPSALLAG